MNTARHSTHPSCAGEALFTLHPLPSTPATSYTRFAIKDTASASSSCREAEEQQNTEQPSDSKIQRLQEFLAAESLELSQLQWLHLNRRAYNLTQHALR